MKINKSTLQEFRDDFKRVIAELEEKYQIQINLQQINYDEFGFDFKGRANLEGGAQKEFERYAPSYGLNVTDFGKIIFIKNKPYKICGWKRNAKKNKVIICDGKNQYRTSPMNIKILLSKIEEL